MPPDQSETLARIHEGWDHLRHQRPLAAWSSWRQALRLDPENAAAAEALERLASAQELPMPARTVYRFRPPATSHRKRWDEAFAGRDLADLQAASAVFADLAEADPDDAASFYNLALCLAWRGENPGAVAALEEFVTREADEAAAIAAWTLAEVLRQGGGAEDLADDVSHTLEMSWDASWGDPVAWLSGFAPLREILRAADPTFPDVRAFEWLDRPMPPARSDLQVDDLPRVRVSVIVMSGSVRFSSPDDEDLWSLRDELEGEAAPRSPRFDTRTVPLPLTLGDVGVWRFRLPDGLDPEVEDSLTREAVERHFEGRWIQVIRRGLSATRPLNPRVAAREAATDRTLRRKLLAIVAMREAIAARPRSAPLYRGYPFDRLRRRLGLPPDDPNAIDPDDVSCMGEAELASLDLAAIDDTTLADAHRSARSVCETPTLARMEAALAARGLKIPED